MNDDFIQRLEKLAEHLTKLNRADAEQRAKNYFSVLEEVQDLSSSGPLAKGLKGMICSLDPTAVGKFTDDGRSFFRRKVAPSDIRRILIQYFQVRYSFACQEWSLVASPDPSQPEMDNLRSCTVLVSGASLRDCYERDRTLWDVFQMLGQLAHNVKSAFRRRVVRFLVRMDRLRGNGVWWVPADQAERLVDEFILCWQLVMKEASFVDATEKPGIWPKRPVHGIEPASISINTRGLTAEEATEESHDESFYDYCERMKIIRSTAKSGQDPFEELCRAVGQLVEAISEAKPRKRLSLPFVDYAFLSYVLAADTQFTYNAYEEDESGNGELTEYQEDESTSEEDAKWSVVNDLSLYLDKACKLAKEVGSKAYDDLARCQQIIQMRCGDFFDCEDWEEQRAARDLELFITGLERSAPILAADVENYVPPRESVLTKSDGEKLKAHITAEADREIAAKAPKRKKKFQHEGNGLKGKKTKYQKEQFGAQPFNLKSSSP